MTDILIRNVPDEVLSGIDANAKRLGLSRTDYLRRKLAQDAAAATRPVTVDDLRELAERHADLADEDIMAEAWR